MLKSIEEKNEKFNAGLNEDTGHSTKDTENFLEVVVLSRSTIYLKIIVYKLVRKYPCLQSLI